MNRIDFPFSDLIAGYVTRFDAQTDQFDLRTCDGRQYRVRLTPTTFAELIRNLGEAFKNATDHIREMLTPERFLFVYGIFFPDGADGDHPFEAKHIVFLGRVDSEYRFEQPDWWIRQLRQLADFYLHAELGDGEIDYSSYRTNLTITGDKQKSGRQETDTLSRLVYGFASAYLLTGDDRYLEAAEEGTQYLSKHLRYEEKGEGICYWYHAIDIGDDGSVQKIFASENGDDFDAIPCYEQIYALAGPTQTYRITGDPAILADIESTVNLFHRFFKDHCEKGGYFSHIDPITFSPHSETLGRNRARKNWNSVGDHAPAYLINLFLATGRAEFADFLEYTFDTIVEHFPDYEHSPFVQERFFEDWTKDQEWGWQQNRAVVGHNLKIAWNLMRMHSLRGKDAYESFARKIAEVMPKVGRDEQRCGWYDVVERVVEPGQRFHRFAWHDRKAWWQQEQGILAFLILSGVLKEPQYLEVARQSSAFYNAWQLDVDSGAVYFNVLAEGLPYALGTERGKGSHSMAGYHAFELAYLATVYTNLLITKEPLDLYFKPRPGGFPDNVLRVAPDILPAGSVRLGQVWINGHEYTDFDPATMTVRLPRDQDELRVRVRLVPGKVAFSADFLDVVEGRARISLAGSLGSQSIRYLREAIDASLEEQAKSIVFDATDLEEITDEGLRAMIFTKQHLGASFEIAIAGASAALRGAIQASEFNEEVRLLP